MFKVFGVFVCLFAGNVIIRDIWSRCLHTLILIYACAHKYDNSILLKYCLKLLIICCHIVDKQQSLLFFKAIPKNLYYTNDYFEVLPLSNCPVEQFFIYGSG